MKPPVRADRPRRGIPLRTIVPNAVTALALCSGLFGIRFGSRVDVYLPEGTTPQIILGQRAIAGETLIARVGQSELIEGISQ